VNVSSAVTTYLFTDIEGSTRLWELEPERMRPALARHDAIARATVEQNRGTVVKMTGDGLHATFDDPLDAVKATIELQKSLSNADATEGIALQVRCGLHAGVDERRDSDYFGRGVNRAARIMTAAHGGQVLLSHAVAVLVADRLPSSVALRELGSVRLRDLTNPERVYQLIHPELRQDFPALRSLEATPNNLPLQLTSFVGREIEIVEVKKLLRESRLLTLVGVGGIGKTRLSLQVAADSMDDYPDGVWFVELAPVTDQRMVPQALASVVGVKEEAGRPVVEALVKYVNDRCLLIVLDNCEHLIGACAELAKQLLQSGKLLKILASSREALHVAGEAIYSVPALAAPDPSAKLMHTALTEYAAARLFVERAVAAQPAFALSEQNAAPVADICHRLEGIPLAIELAAARLRAMSVEEIAARLSDRFRLLSRGDRTALPRQQTLRALIDWSYDLLTEQERALLRRLAVFAGGWTLEAAEAVVPMDGLSKEEVLDVLQHLVDKSLVALDAEGRRYRLLDTIRQYALERLNESGEQDRIRGCHLAQYLAFAEKARPELLGPNRRDWLARLDAEHENLLSAHRWCDNAQGGAAMGLRLVSAVKHYWLTRGLLGLGHREVLEALGRVGAKEHDLARCRGLFDAGQLCIGMGRYREAQRYLEESLAIAKQIGDKGRLARVLQPLGIAFLGQGESATARQHLEEAVTLARELGDKRELAAAINQLAQLHRVEGRLAAAEPLYEQVGSLARELGDRESIAISLLNLAMVCVGRGFAARAREMLLEVFAIADEIGSRPVGQSVLEVAAGLAAMRKEWERAAHFYGTAEAQAGQTGLRRDPADEAFLAPRIAAARQALGETRFTAAETAGRTVPYDEAVRATRVWLQQSS